MPVVGVYHDCLKEALEGSFEVTEESFETLCFDFGLELDDVTSDFKMVEKERGLDAAKASGASERVIYKIDVPANRYDLLCLEGIVRALKIFKGLMEAPQYTLSSPKAAPDMRLTVKASTAQIRPFCVAAVLRGVTFDDDRYKSFIDLQDRLHQQIGRKRTLVSMGTHDLSTIKPPFSYEARDPKDIWFRPLYQTEEMDGHRMMEVLQQHQQLKNYLYIIKDSPVFPVIYDSNGVVLSLPPIINGDHSKIRMETKDVFIEITATDLTKATIALNTLVAMFSEYCTKPFTVEPVEVVYEDSYPANQFTKGGDRVVTPDLKPVLMDADVGRMKQALSIEQLTSDQVRDYIRKMSIPCDLDKKNPNTLHVQVPVTRSDIMHECDLVEDLAIAYGYNNLPTEVPQTYGGASEQPINHLTDLIRAVLANAGWTEAYNWALISRQENFQFLRREEKAEELWRPVAAPNEYSPSLVAVSIANPVNKELEIVRTSLLPGVLKCLHSNKHLPAPIRIFEVADVVIQEPTMEVGARNYRRVCAVNGGKDTADFAKLHGLLDQLMYSLRCEQAHERKEGSKKRLFRLEPSNEPTFFPGQQAKIIVEDTVIGVIGVLHPEVVGPKAFDVNMPTSAFEINLEPFLQWL